MITSRNFEALLVILLAAGIVLATSIRPTMKLRSDMPEEFDAAPPSSTAQEQAQEKRIARAYWICATTVIVQKYGGRYRIAFPADPPPEFNVAADDLGPTANDSETQKRYWRKLRELWYLDSTWTTAYEWDSSWLTDPLTFGVSWLRDYIQQRRFTILPGHQASIHSGVTGMRAQAAPGINGVQE